MADSGQTRWDRHLDKPRRIRLLDEGTIPGRCDDLSKWVTSGTGVTESLERGICMNGYGAVRADSTSGTIKIVHVPAAPVDWQNKAITVRFYLSDLAAFGTERLYIFTDASNYYTINLTSKCLTGWNQFILLNGDFTATGSPDWTSIAYYEFRCSITTPPVYTVLDHWAVDNPGPCIVIPTTDDVSNVIVNDYLPVCAANGVEMTNYIITNDVGNPSSLTEANLATLYAAGWDVASHTMSHTDLTTLTESQVIAEITGARDYLLALGFSRSADHLSYPFSALNWAVFNQAKLLCRTARIGSTYTQAGHMPAYATQTWIGPGYGVDALSTAAFATLIDNAILRKGVFIPYWHSLAAASFQTEMEYIKAKVDAGSLVTMTISEYWTWLCNRYGGSRRWKTKQT